MAFPDYKADHYYRYDELVEWLKAMQEARPNLMKLYSIGKSYEGRDIWLAELTNQQTGLGEEKPGYWLDAQIHASEFTGCATAMFTINRLLTTYEKDDQAKYVLDNTVMYVVPRISPDGAEHVLTTGQYIRSSKHRYPYEDDPIEGLVPQDINGDGEILQVRLEDPLGEWKVSEKDPRLMLRRDPEERGGKYFRLYSEGLFENFDGFEKKVGRSPYGLDLNRNFPYDWQQEHKQFGAGELPLGEPETRAIGEFITAHKNISCGVTLHTFSAVLLRPYSSFPDEHYPDLDLNLYKAIGDRCEKLTGYPCVAVYHGFRYDAKETIRGTFDDWAYDHRGIIAYTMELWSIVKQSGIEVKDHIEDLRKLTEDDYLKMLKWVDENTEGKGFAEWKPFEHPQLGKVEIGGWRRLYTWTNPPNSFLPAECEKASHFLLSHAMCLPKLFLREFKADDLGAGLKKLTLIFANDGYLPTNGTQQALDHKLVKPIEITLELPDGAELVQGKLREEVGHLTGRGNVVAGVFSSTVWFGGTPNSYEKKLEWVVKNADSASVTIKSERAGVLKAKL